MSSHWILLRGLTRDARHWGSFPQALQTALPSAKLLLPDLPGNGLRHLQRSPAQVAAMTDGWRTELLASQVPRPWNLLAMSLGAMVAVDWANRYPQDLGRCVLINTSLRPHAPMHWRLRPVAWWPFLQLLLRSGNAELAERSIARLTTRHHAEAQRRLPDWIAWRRSHPVAPANALRQLLAAARFRAPQQAPAVPLLMLAGGADQLVDPRCSQRLAMAWGCPLRVHPHAGHDLPLDDEAWVVAQISQWLKPSPAAPG